ncbi:MAG: hypothetical protein ACU84Q_14380 [Gammaproteobacteria bacterium]
MNWAMLDVIAQTAGVVAVVVSLVYLARQVDIANRLARAEASRTPNSDLNLLNSTFGTDPIFRRQFQEVLRGAGLFLLPYYRSSWPLFRPYFNTKFVEMFEEQHNFDQTIKAQW